MSRSKTRSRKKVRQQQKQQRQIIAAASVVGVLALLVIGYVVTRPPAPPEVASTRLQLDPILGDPNAPVSIVEYGAYSCHACQHLHETGAIDRILADYNGQVNFIFRDFPFITPTYDHMAAEVAQCVLDQGNEPFWQFHDLLYTEFYANSSRAALVDVAAERVGVDEAALNACVTALTHYNTVQYDADRGLRLGIQGTPTLFVNEQRVFSPREDVIREAVEITLRG